MKTSVLVDRITGRMRELDLNPYATARRAGLGDDYVRDLLRGKVRNPSAERLGKLAVALETTIQDLLGPEAVLETFRPPESASPIPGAPPAASALLPIRGALLGAAYRTKSEDNETLGFFPGSIPDGLRPTDTWYEFLQDDSQDQLIQPGSLIQVIPFAEGEELRDGDWIIVTKTMQIDGGRLVASERSLRRAERIYPHLPLLFLEFNSRSSRFLEQEDVIYIREDSTPPPPPDMIYNVKHGVSDHTAEKLERLEELLGDSEAFSEFILEAERDRAKVVGRAIRFITPLRSDDTFGVKAELYFG